MQRKAFIEPLPRHKVIAFLVILCLGIVMLIAAAAFSPQGFLLSFGQGLGTSFIAVALVDLIPEMVRRLQERPARRRAEHFFGKEGFKKGFHLVSAERTIDRSFLKHLFAPGAPEKYKDDKTKTMRALPEGVRSWLAEQDIRAASYISGLFERENISFEIGIDSDANKRLELTSLIALGLGFNSCTNKLSGLRFESPLFKIDWGKSKLDPSLGDTDELTVGSTKVTLTEDDIKRNLDYALIARIVAKPDSGYVQFVCGGRSANGTAVAGQFLANKWKELANEYKNEAEMDTHSLAVIIQHKTGVAGVADAIYLDDSGQIFRSFGIVKARCNA